MSEQINAPGFLDPPLSMAVTAHGGQAVLHLSQPREYVALMPVEALQVSARMALASVEADPSAAQAAIAAALAIVDAVYELRGDIKPAGGAVKHELIERHRKTLQTRLAIVLNSEREKRTTSNAKLARQLVDICLNEIFS